MDGDSGPGVGAVTISVQAGGVGITICGVDVVEMLLGAAGEATQAERIKDRSKNEEIIRMFDSVDHQPHLPYLIACLSSSKEVIQAMVLMNSSSEALWSRSARTAGPTGSSPAAPPGVSA